MTCQHLGEATRCLQIRKTLTWILAGREGFGPKIAAWILPKHLDTNQGILRKSRGTVHNPGLPKSLRRQKEVPARQAHCYAGQISCRTDLVFIASYAFVFDPRASAYHSRI